MTIRLGFPWKELEISSRLPLASIFLIAEASFWEQNVSKLVGECAANYGRRSFSTESLTPTMRYNCTLAYPVARPFESTPTHTTTQPEHKPRWPPQPETQRVGIQSCRASPCTHLPDSFPTRVGSIVSCFDKHRKSRVVSHPGGIHPTGSHTRCEKDDEQDVLHKVK